MQCLMSLMSSRGCNFFFFAKSPLSHLTDRADLMEAVYAPAVPKPAHGGGV